MCEGRMRVKLVNSDNPWYRKKKRKTIEPLDVLELDRNHINVSWPIIIIVCILVAILIYIC